MCRGSPCGCPSLNTYSRQRAVGGLPSGGSLWRRTTPLQTRCIPLKETFKGGSVYLHKTAIPKACATSMFWHTHTHTQKETHLIVFVSAAKAPERPKSGSGSFDSALYSPPTSEFALSDGFSAPSPVNLDA